MSDFSHLRNLKGSELADHLLSNLSAEDFSKLPAEFVQELLGKIQVLGTVEEGSGQFANVSLLNIQQSYQERFTTAAFVGFLFRSLDEWRTPDGLNVVSVRDAIDDPSLLDTPDTITKNACPHALRSYKLQREAMVDKIAIYRFFEEMFQFNPVEHTRSSYAPYYADPARRILQSEASRLAITWLEKIDEDFHASADGHTESQKRTKKRFNRASDDQLIASASVLNPNVTISEVASAKSGGKKTTAGISTRVITRTLTDKHGKVHKLSREVVVNDKQLARMASVDHVKRLASVVRKVAYFATSADSAVNMWAESEIHMHTSSRLALESRKFAVHLDVNDAEESACLDEIGETAREYVAAVVAMKKATARLGAASKRATKCARLAGDLLEKHDVSRLVPDSVADLLAARNAAPVDAPVAKAKGLAAELNAILDEDLGIDADVIAAKQAGVAQQLQYYLPPQDMFYNFRRFSEDHTEVIREFVRASTAMEPKVENMVLVHSVHATEDGAREYRQKHADDFKCEVYQVQTGAWGVVTKFKDMRESVEYFNGKTGVLEAMFRGQETDARTAKDLVDKRVKKKRAVNEISAGAPADGFAEWARTNADLNNVSAERIGQVSDPTLGDDEIVAPIWRVGRTGEDIARGSFFTQAEAPTRAEPTE